MIQSPRPVSLPQASTRAAIAAASLLALSACGGAKDAGPGDPGLVVPERAGVLTNATAHYGPLIVDEAAENGLFVEADTRPWSGYWFPITDDILVRGSDRNGGQCTLEKYDKYSEKMFGVRSYSQKNEIAIGDYVQSEEIGWQGRCNAWAIASVFEPEPVLPASGVTVPGSGVTFHTRDVKALVIKSYELIDNTQLLRFGERNDGLPDPERPGSEDYQDIYPDQFHRVLQAELIDKHRPILMDSDPGPQVWNKPFWRAQINMRRDGGDPRILHVETSVSAVMSESDLVGPDYVGTRNKVLSYTYDLIGLPQDDGRLLVKYGRWTGRSIKDHPDFIFALPPKGTPIHHSSHNKQLDGAVVDDILRKTGALRRR